MAKKVTLKRRSGSSWETMYPETTVDQVIGIGQLGAEFLSTTFDKTKNSVIKLTTAGTFGTIPLEDLPREIGASPSNHTHTLSDLTNWQSTMNQYADLDSNDKVPGSQLPSWVIGGLKLHDVLTKNQTLNETTFMTLFGIPSGTALSDLEFHAGKYLVVEPSGGALSVKVTVAGNAVVYGEEARGQIIDGGEIDLESGDWLVFRSYEDGKYYFDIVNNTYERASSEFYGTVKLSTAVSRASLTGGLNVITEGNLKNILKKIHYSDSSIPSNDIEDGDIWFHVMGNV